LEPAGGAVVVVVAAEQGQGKFSAALLGADRLVHGALVEGIGSGDMKAWGMSRGGCGSGNKDD